MEIAQNQPRNISRITASSNN